MNISDGVPLIENQEFTVPENIPEGIIVGVVEASDPNAGQALSYSITAGNSLGVFAIGSETGIITVADVDGLNFETNPTFALTVQVSDGGSPARTASATMDIDLADMPEGVAEETEAQRITWLNGGYDYIQSLLTQLDPENESGHMGLVMADLNELDTLITYMLVDIATEDWETFATDLADYHTAMNNLNGHLTTVYADAYHTLETAAHLIQYTEGDVLRIEAITSLLNTLSAHLNVLDDRIQQTQSNTQIVVTALGSSPPILTSANTNFNGASATIGFILLGIPYVFVGTPTPQDPENPPETGVNPGIDRVADFNEIAGEILASLAALEAAVDGALAVIGNMFDWGEIMTSNWITDLPTFALNKGYYFGEEGLDELVGDVDPEEDYGLVQFQADSCVRGSRCSQP